MRPITSLIQFKRGDHICIFYRDETTLVHTLAHYIVDGIRRNERCFCVQKETVIPRLLRELESLGIDTAQEAQRGALDIHTIDEFYFNGAGFHPEALMDSLEKSIAAAVARGFSGMRTAGELSWIMESHHHDDGALCDQLVGYEKMVQESFPSRPVIGVCQYAADLFPPDVLQRVLEAHRIALEETMVSTNHSTLTLRVGEFLADIVTDRVNPGEAFHYVVQKRASKDVLSWGQEPTIDAAIQSSESIMAELGG